MKEQHIIVNRTARFYTLGELNPHTKQVWFVLHGFGYSAKNFLELFAPLANDETLFIAPEALNRFYLKGTSGNVGASWMTREDRLNEIKDYINYLDDLYEHFELEQYPNLKITALGFSQGSSTLTRWANATRHRLDNAIFYAGEITDDVLPLHETSPLRKSKNYYAYGDKDKYITLEQFKMVAERAKDLNLTLIPFEGEHEIKVELLKRFF